MDTSDFRLDPVDAERQFAAILDDAGLPRFDSSHHNAGADMLELTWDHGLTLHMDLTRAVDPLDEWERSAILGGPVCECESLTDVTVVGSPADPRTPSRSRA